MSRLSGNFEAALQALKQVQSDSRAGTCSKHLGVASSNALDDRDLAQGDAQCLRWSSLRKVYEQKDYLKELAEEMRPSGPAGEGALFGRIRKAADQLKHLEDSLAEQYVPAHSARQLMSPQALLVSPLFNVKSKATARQLLIRVCLYKDERSEVLYQGPELRQSDGLVFMALLNLARDYRVGTTVQFDAGKVCKALYGYYDGRSRGQLKESIKRLMGAVLTFPEFSVQLALRFSHPRRGLWAVSLDPDIVKVFSHSSEVWLDFQLRQSLPEGLTSWLYGYVRSQPRLLPVPTQELLQRCGSEARDTQTFQRQLSRALNELVTHHVIDEDWAIRAGMLTWSKARPSEQTPQASAALTEADAN